MIMTWIIILLGYLLGSIPTAYIASRLAKRRDIRQMGDGNVGAANAFRNLGARTGIGVFLVDAGKGALAIFIAQVANLPQIAILLTGLATVIGHNWPVFLRFRGGKGFSTIIGVLGAVVTQPVLILAIPTLTALFIKRDTAVAGYVMFISLPLVCWLMGVSGMLIAYGLALPCLLGLTNFIRTRQAIRASETEID